MVSEVKGRRRQGSRCHFMMAQLYLDESYSKVEIKPDGA